jgi:hypothetical protein
VRRMFWLSLGAAAGYYAARKGQVVVDEARERGLVGNLTLAAATAARVTTSVSRATVAVGEAVGSRTRGTGPAAPDAPRTDVPNSREVRP